MLRLGSMPRLSNGLMKVNVEKLASFGLVKTE